VNTKSTFFALLIILLVAGTSQAQPYQTINTENSTVGGDLSRTVTTIQSGDNPINRFYMTRVVKAGVPNQGLQGVILLLPPLGSGFQNYEASGDGDYNSSFAAFFARRNFAVVGYSPRQQGLTAGACESGTIDCSPMAGDYRPSSVTSRTFASKSPRIFRISRSLSVDCRWAASLPWPH
jgi:hypothetical protein